MAKAATLDAEATEVLDPTATALTAATASGAVTISDDDFFGGDTGLEGVTAADVSLPRWTILQGLSPQVNPRKDEYVPGAQIGMILNTATGELAQEKNFVFAAYERRFVEWVPRDQRSACPLRNFPTPVGGGLYRDYGTDPSVLRECTEWAENGSLWTPRGNELQETGTWYTVDPDTLATAFIAMAKTQFTSSKKLMAGIRDERMPGPGGIGTRPALLFFRAWTLGTALRSKSSDGGDTKEWFVWHHKPAFRLQEHANGRAVLEVVRSIQEQLKAGEVTVDVGAGESQDTGPGTSNHDSGAAM